MGRNEGPQRRFRSIYIIYSRGLGVHVTTDSERMVSWESKGKFRHAEEKGKLNIFQKVNRQERIEVGRPLGQSRATGTNRPGPRGVPAVRSCRTVGGR